jgi:uncharacterized protein YbjT (DUF2867 family)
MPSALMLGATGLVGSHLLQRVLDASRYDVVTSLVRRPSGNMHPKLKEVPVMFDELALFRNSIRGDDVFCCLGTTLRAAGSREAFRKVDEEYVVNAAHLALQNGAVRFFLISSVGANPRSSFFYTQVKGEVERTISAMPFPSVVILRPSMLLGERKEKRPAERIVGGLMSSVSVAMVGPLGRYRPVHADTVARAMLAAAATERPGVSIYEGQEIESLARMIPS